MTKLETRVAGVNAANQYASVIYPQLREVFEPLVGASILKVNGDLLIKVQAKVDALKFASNGVLSVYRQRSNYYLGWVVKTCYQNNDEGCYYHETTVYVGELNGQVLTKLSDSPTFRTDYKASEIQKARDEYKAADKIASEAKSKLYLFGEFDR